MELVYEFTIQIDVGETLVPGAGAHGLRMVIPVTGGSVRGDRISGSVVGPGADWVLVGPDGFGRIDVRGQIATEDGAVIYVSYDGLLELNDAVQTALLGGSTDFDDQYFRTAPRLETGDERYAWVNTTMFIARGRLVDDGVEYEVFRVS